MARLRAAGRAFRREMARAATGERGTEALASSQRSIGKVLFCVRLVACGCLPERLGSRQSLPAFSPQRFLVRDGRVIVLDERLQIGGKPWQPGKPAVAGQTLAGFRGCRA